VISKLAYIYRSYGLHLATRIVKKRGHLVTDQVHDAQPRLLDANDNHAVWRGSIFEVRGTPEFYSEDAHLAQGNHHEG
jgi:hypothetical protein